VIKFITITVKPESEGEADAAWAADITGVEGAGANGSNGSTTAVTAAVTNGAVTHGAASNGAAAEAAVTDVAASNGAATHAEPSNGAIATAVASNGSSSNGANGASPTCGRTTRFGSLLRRTSLDEVPQIFNVLRGEMSVVGPRPERRSYVDLFEG